MTPRTTTTVLALVAALVAPLPGAHALTLAYHDGTGEGALQGLAAGDAEALRFSPEHPARLRAVRLWTQGSGPVEVHVWPDNGGLQPDETRDLVPPATLEATEGQPVTVTFPGEGLAIAPPQAFFVGIVHTGALPALLVDTHTPFEYRSLVLMYVAEFGKKIWSGLDGTYLVEADLDYVDVATTRWFTDVTEASGAAPGGRLSWPDYDGDGDPDLCVNGGALYRNEGDGTFTDVTASAGIGGAGTNGGVWADYDNDGDIDLYATVSSFESGDPTRHDRLWRNEGNGTFTDVSDAAGRPYDDLPTEAAAWADYDGDGFVDLYVANYEQPGDTLAIGTPDFLWHNEGDGTFLDASERSGIRAVAPQCGRGVAWADVDGDADLDVYVSNYRLDRNFLFVNQGDGTFVDEAEARGVAGIRDGSAYDPAYGHTIGSVFGDLDGDGDLDLVAANLAHPRFIEFSDKTMIYRAEGAPSWTFTDVRAAAGIAYAETHSNPALGDLDNDGDLDLHITSVYEDRTSFLYRNEGGLRFAEVSYPSGLVVWNGWGSTFVDYDRDGDLDFASNRLFRNDMAETEAVGHWLSVRLEGTRSNRSAIGARIVVVAGGRTFVRQVEGGTGTGCQPPLEQHVGLGDATTVELVAVRWPTGVSETRSGPLAVDQRLVLREGEVAVVPPPPEPVVERSTGAELGTDVAAPVADIAPAMDTPAGTDAARADVGAPVPVGGASGCASADGTPATPAPLALLLAALAGLIALRPRV